VAVSGSILSGDETHDEIRKLTPPRPCIAFLLANARIQEETNLETLVAPDQMDPINDDVEITPEIEYCKSHHMNIFVGCIYAYKGLLMVSPLARVTRATGEPRPIRGLG